MITHKIPLNNPERWQQDYRLEKSKIIKAAEKATDKLEALIPKYKDAFAEGGYVYRMQEANQWWTAGFQTGCFWLAYEITGNKAFKDVAEHHFTSYKKRFDEKINIDDHDVGFVYTPSCVAQYKITGNAQAREYALKAAKYLYDKSYSKEGRFIIRCHTNWDSGDGCRTMMDSLMNAPLLFWAAEETGNQDYYHAALEHNKTTAEYLIRADGSSYHHYQFDPKTAKPVKGLTFQGFSDESCWSRGHSWGISGFPITYSYTKDDSFIKLHEGVTYYMLNNLPDDCIPYWDYHFSQGSIEPRDSSAGVIAICGMKEMCRHLPDEAEQKKIYQNASAMMLEAVIDRCTGEIGTEYDGLICHVTAALPQKADIDACALYGDYFYLEALLRYINPDWEMYW